MRALMGSMDWSKTPVGPIESWSASLRMMVKFLLANRFPLLLWWGPQYCQFYNDPYRPVLGAKHPKSMGQPARECFPEVWPIIGPLIDMPFSGGPATWMDDLALEYRRQDILEEAHFTVAYSPVPDDAVASGIGGVLATVHEITEKVFGERRVVALRDLGIRSADAKTAEEACKIAAAILAGHSKDIPFALFYLLELDRDRAWLAAACGVEKGSVASPLVINLSPQDSSEVWPILEVVLGEKTVVVEDLAAKLTAVPRGPWSDPPHSAALIPIRSNIAHQLAGVLVVGISPRQRFDELYQSFLDLVSTQVATAVANARAYEEERRRAEALAELDRAKTAFFGNVSHEFRTPLTLILGPLEDLLSSSKSGLAPEDRALVTVVYRNSLRLLKLVNTLLDFSRIEAGRIEAVYQPTDISSFTADLASSFRSAMERAGIRYEVDCPPLSEQVFVDRDMWEKIVLNLLSNAFKFTFQGTVTIRIRPIGHFVQLQVGDTGTGIPAHELPHLFERFHRVEEARGRTYEGTGIGLALVQELVKLHGGTISVESKEGEGSTFTVTIPKGKRHLSHDRIDAVQIRASSPLGAKSHVEEALGSLPPDFGELQEKVVAPGYGAPSMAEGLLLRGQEAEGSGALIVLADDNSDMRHYVQRLLSGRYRVHAVSNGEEAVKAAREFDADLIITDVMMPRLDGFGVLRALRNDPVMRTKPVILIAARAGEESKIEGIQAGADDYLIKPFTARELLARVGANLKMARIRTEVSHMERRLRAEADLERDRLRDSFAQAPAPTALLNGPDHNYVFMNSAYLRLAGRTANDLMGKSFQEAFPEIEGQGYYELLDNVFKSGETFIATESEVRFFREGRQESIYLDFTYVPMKKLTGEVEGILFQGVDVTEQVLARNQLEQRVRERTAELERAEDSLRTLNQTLMRAQDEERRRLALELHDGAGQLLVALRWKLGPLMENISVLRPELGQVAQDSLALVDELSNELRTVSHLLHPVVFGEGRLSPALRSYMAGLAERSGLVVDLEVDPHLPRMSPEIETTLFRIVQESLTNVYRHADTTTAAVRINAIGQNVCLEIKDNGSGIPGFFSLDDPTLKVGVGIQGMRERIRRLKGRFEIQSGKGGTTVTAVLPMSSGHEVASTKADTIN